MTGPENFRVNTLDIETDIVKGLHVVSAAAALDAAKLRLCVGRDSLETILSFFLYSGKMHNSRVAFISHNFSNFDSYFIIKVLKK